MLAGEFKLELLFPKLELLFPRDPVELEADRPTELVPDRESV